MFADPRGYTKVSGELEAENSALHIITKINQIFIRQDLDGVDRQRRRWLEPLDGSGDSMQ